MFFSTPTKVVPLQELARTESSNTITAAAVDENGNNLSPMTSASKYIENRMSNIDELIITRRNEFSALRQSNRLKYSGTLPALKVGSSIPILAKKTAPTITSPLPPDGSVAFSPTEDELYTLKNESMFLRGQLATKSAQLAELQHEAASKDSRMSEVETRMNEYVHYSDNLRQELDNMRCELHERQLNSSHSELFNKEYRRMKEAWEATKQHNRDLQYQLNERDNDLTIVYDRYTILEDNFEQLQSKLQMRLRNTNALLRLASKGQGRELLLKHYFCRLQLHAASKFRVLQDISVKSGNNKKTKTIVPMAAIGAKSNAHVLCLLAVFQCSVLYALCTIAVKLIST